MSMILYFHALNFSAPSTFSSNFVFLFIFNIMRTSNGIGKKSTYLKKIVSGWPPSGRPRVWCRNPNKVERWKRRTLLRWGRLYLPFSEIDDETLVCPGISNRSKIENSWNSILSPQKDAPFRGELDEPSFLVELSKDLLKTTNPRCVVSPFRVALKPC